MKQTFLAIIVALGATFANGQVELKGIKLGEKGNNEVTVTTLGSVPGIIMASNLNDSTTYQLVFVPTNDGENIDRISKTQTERLKNGMEITFGIKLRKMQVNRYSDDWYSRVEKDGVTYVFRVEVNEFMDLPNKVTIGIYNDRLYKINKKEEQQKANSDF